MKLRFIDLFCGIGGFRVAASIVAEKRGDLLKAVFASEIDPECRKSYEANFGEAPHGDIRLIQATKVPDHDLLLAGFPCQPFSIIGDLQGFADERGTLFFELKRIIAAKRPAAFILENVKQLRGHDEGRTLKHIIKVLKDELKYDVHVTVLNALDFGLPQKRERILIVGFRVPSIFNFPEGGIPMKPLKDILEVSVGDRYIASPKIQKARQEWHDVDDEPTIWHENKAGNISKYKFSCALRAGASYNYLLVDGIRRLTEREMLRLQGFPDSFKIVCNYSQTRKQAGNSVPVPMIAAVIENVVASLDLQRQLVEQNTPSHIEVRGSSISA